jgi:hypothetical protein
MTRRLLLLVLALTILATTALPSAAAPPSAVALTTTWRKELGVSLTSVAVGAHRSIFVAGSQANGKFQTKSFLAKLSPAGTVLWTRTWLPSNKINPATHTPWYSAWATAVTVAKDGTIVLPAVERSAARVAAGSSGVRPSGKAALFGRWGEVSGADAAVRRRSWRGGLVVVAGQDFLLRRPGGRRLGRGLRRWLHPRWKPSSNRPRRSRGRGTTRPKASSAPGNVCAGGWASTERLHPAAPFSGVGSVVLGST